MASEFSTPEMAGSSFPRSTDIFPCFYVLPCVDGARDVVIRYEIYLNECLLTFGSLYGCWFHVDRSFVSNGLIPLLAAVCSPYGSPRAVGA